MSVADIEGQKPHDDSYTIQRQQKDASEWAGLRRVPDKLPIVALLILVVEVMYIHATPTLTVAIITCLLFPAAWGAVHIFRSQWTNPKLHKVSLTTNIINRFTLHLHQQANA
jgi:hypothetical protein